VPVIVPVIVPVVSPAVSPVIASVSSIVVSVSAVVVPVSPIIIPTAIVVSVVQAATIGAIGPILSPAVLRAAIRPVAVHLRDASAAEYFAASLGRLRRVARGVQLAGGSN
jgi:hypothetical protein